MYLKLQKKNLLLTNSIFFLLFLIFLNSCVTVTTVNDKNISTPYNPSSSILHPQYFVHLKAENKTHLYLKINLLELFFSKITKEQKLKAKLKIKYYIYKSYKNTNVVDSASRIIEIEKNQQKILTTYIEIKEIELDSYLLEIHTQDMYRKISVKSYIFVDKKSKGSRQNYLVISYNDLKPYFQSFFRPDNKLRIFNNRSNSEFIFVKYYKYEFPLPLPPFSTIYPIQNKIIPDSIYKITNNNGIEFSQKEKGLYYFQTDTSKKEGLLLTNYGYNYPVVANSQDLIKPLQYLSSTNEFKELNKSKNKKLAIDEFWFNCTGNYKRSRELIRVFYNRVIFANVYFSSYTQGWRTDRGMIYTIFGPPKTVYKTSTSERWIYGDKKSFKRIEFLFRKINSQVSDNDFVLQRNAAYRAYWIKAIESWRSGRIYAFTN